MYMYMYTYIYIYVHVHVHVYVYVYVYVCINIYIYMYIISNVGLFSPGQGAPCPVKLAAPDVAPRWSFPNEPRQGWATEAMVIDDGSDRDFRGKTMENHGE